MPTQGTPPQQSADSRFPYNELRDTYTIAGREHPASALFLDQPAHERHRRNIPSETLHIHLTSNCPRTDQQRKDLDEFFHFFEEYHGKAFTLFSVVKLLSAIACRIAQVMAGTGPYRAVDAQPSMPVRSELFKHGPAVETEYRRLYGMIIADMGRRSVRFGPRDGGQGSAARGREHAREGRREDGPSATPSSGNEPDNPAPPHFLTELREHAHEVAGFGIAISNMMTRHFFLPLQGTDSLMSNSAPNTVIPGSSYTMGMLRLRLPFSGQQLGLPAATNPIMTGTFVAPAGELNQLTTFVNNLLSDGHIYPAEGAYILHRLDTARRGEPIPNYWRTIDHRYMSMLVELISNQDAAEATLRLLGEADNDGFPFPERLRPVAIRLLGSQFDTPDQAETTLREIIDAFDHMGTESEAGDAEIPTAEVPTALFVRRVLPADCTVCLDAVTGRQLESGEAGTVGCGHLFHVECIDGWVNRSGMMGSNLCPNCRTVMFGAGEWEDGSEYEE